MHINYYEVLAFIVSVITFLYGCLFLVKKDMYNKLFLYASGCYLLEELWVIVNYLFGHIDSLLTVRLFGIFGMYCFLLTASIIQLERVKEKRINIKAFIAPIIFFIIYLLGCIYYSSSYALLGFVIFLPMFVASYYNLKALLLISKNKSLKKNKLINIFSILFYVLNMSYLFPIISLNRSMLGTYDLFVNIIMFILIILNKRSVKNE